MTHKKTKIVYIIPTYNERENIYAMLESVYKILQKLKKYDSKILIVDDTSPDGTVDLIKKFQKKHHSVHLLLGPKKGLGSAMIRGYKFAIERLKADIVITNEADFSYSPSRIPYMVKKIEEGKDVVTARRKISANREWSKGRRLIHFIANTIFAYFFAGINEIQDHNSAFKAVRVDGVLDKINFRGFPTGFAFFNYFNFQLLKHTSKIDEFLTTYYPRTRGHSKISLNPRYLKSFLKDSIEYIQVCFRIRSERTKI